MLFLRAFTQILNGLCAGVTQVLLDGLDLLLEEVLALLLVHLFVGAAADIFLDILHLVLLLQRAEHVGSSVHERIDGQQFLLVPGGEGVNSADVVDQRGVATHTADRYLGIYGRIVLVAQKLQHHLAEVIYYRAKLFVAGLGHQLVAEAHITHESAARFSLKISYLYAV